MHITHPPREGVPAAVHSCIPALFYFRSEREGGHLVLLEPGPKGARRDYTTSSLWAGSRRKEEPFSTDQRADQRMGEHRGPQEPRRVAPSLSGLLPHMHSQASRGSANCSEGTAGPGHPNPCVLKSQQVGARMQYCLCCQATQELGWLLGNPTFTNHLLSPLATGCHL